MRLGKPISYFSLDWSGLKRLSQFLFLCLHLCLCHVRTLSIFFSLCLPPFRLSLFLSTQPSIYLLLIHSLHPSASVSLLQFFFNPFRRDKPQRKRNSALKTWQSKRYLSGPCRARWRGLQMLYLLGCKHIYQGMNYLLVVYVSAKTCLSRRPVPALEC